MNYYYNIKMMNNIFHSRLNMKLILYSPTVFESYLLFSPCVLKWCECKVSVSDVATRTAFAFEYSVKSNRCMATSYFLVFECKLAFQDLKFLLSQSKTSTFSVRFFLPHFSLILCLFSIVILEYFIQ